MKSKLESLVSKLEFRCHDERDLDWRVKWLNDEDVAKYLGGDPNKRTDQAEQKEWMEEYLNDDSKEFFTILYENKPVGLLGFKNINLKDKQAELFIMIGEASARGKGLGRKSMEWMIDHGFNKMGLKKLELGVQRDNLPALKLYESLGFQETESDNDEEDIWMCLDRNK